MSRPLKRAHLRLIQFEVQRQTELYKLAAVLCLQLGGQPIKSDLPVWNIPRPNSKLHAYYLELVYRGKI